MSQFIEGMSYHGQDRLAERYGITSAEDLKAVADLALKGQKNQHWFPAEIGPQDPRLRNPRHGRKVTYKGNEIVLVVSTSDTNGSLIIVTVFEDTMVSDDEEGPATPRELAAQVTALGQANTALRLENEVIKGKLPLIERALEDRNDEIARLKGVIEANDQEHAGALEAMRAELAKFEALKLALKVIGPYL